jgi:hypothetical protein
VNFPGAQREARIPESGDAAVVLADVLGLKQIQGIRIPNSCQIRRTKFSEIFAKSHVFYVLYTRFPQHKFPIFGDSRGSRIHLLWSFVQ